MNAKRLIATLLLALPMLGNAQDVYFEGELHQEGLNNIDNKIAESTGISYNGKWNTVIIYKGTNTHNYDKGIGMHTIMSYDKDVFMIYSDELKKGVSVPMSVFTKYLKEIQNNPDYQPQYTSKETDETEDILGYECKKRDVAAASILVCLFVK